MFYPQLVAGPIERPQNMLHQFHEKHPFDQKKVVSGLKLMMWGMFKKVVIADRLALFTDPVFNNPTWYSGLIHTLGAIFFAFQIYCDFSGYSDIARGSARVMGYELMTNFDRPYIAKSIGEFWRRWHISLSTWFKDYLYIPLGGNRVSVPRVYLNLFLVFLISGFWHGANWTFIIWGALHGFYLIFGLVTQKARNKWESMFGLNRLVWLKNFFNNGLTFILVTFAWIFFRANSLTDSFYYIRPLLSTPGELFKVLKTKGAYLMQIANISNQVLPCTLLILFLLAMEQANGRFKLLAVFDKWPRYIRWSCYYGVLLVMFFAGVFEQRQFI